MTTNEVTDAIRDAVGSHTGDERELLEELESVAEGWKMRLEELDEEGED